MIFELSKCKTLLNFDLSQSITTAKAAPDRQDRQRLAHRHLEAAHR